MVLTVSQMMWCKDATVALTHEGDDLVRQEKMKEFEQKAFYDLNKLAEVVRGDLPSLTRAILCALITVGERFCRLVSNKLSLGHSYNCVQFFHLVRLRNWHHDLLLLLLQMYTLEISSRVWWPPRSTK